jgi:hypothetical protein
MSAADDAIIWALARDINDSDALMRVYAAPEWDELHDDGKAWVIALVRETRRRTLEEVQNDRIGPCNEKIEALRRAITNVGADGAAMLPTRIDYPGFMNIEAARKAASDIVRGRSESLQFLNQQAQSHGRIRHSPSGLERVL